MAVICTLSPSHRHLLVTLHITSSSLPKVSVLHKHLTLLYLDAICCPVGLKLSQLLFCRVVMCSMAHAHAFLPFCPLSPLSPPLTVLVHLTCSPALFPIVFYTLGQTFKSHKRAELGKSCVCASDFLVCLSLQRARL